ncbi:MAG: hypothetical protein HKN00_07630 [Flavobacteriaceae bacterium]|nr:hypothetical protein [Bacteroidia bacterium]NNF75036.1 hypothetical protein [Flavobacteriaceae bacterium]NNK73983.1 hypothetical protein [Flavobacteriaceae bacterium]
MAQDLRKLFENEPKVSNEKMPDGHEDRFMAKLAEGLPQRPKKRSFNVFRIAASIVILVSLGYVGMRFLSNDPVTPAEEVVSTKSLGEISPELKKVEDYYLASINLELSKLKYTPETKELFDGYVNRLGELALEYERLSNELIQSGPTEQTVTALIDNLKLRLDLMYRLKEKLNELNNDFSVEDLQG